MERLTKSFSVFDCDAHINDPMGIWDYVPESQKELVRNTYWRGDAEAWLNGTTPVMGGGNAHFPGYNPICIAGPQMNKKIMRKLNSMPLTAEQKAYLHHDGAIDAARAAHRDGPHGHRPGARDPHDGDHARAVRRRTPRASTRSARRTTTSSSTGASEESSRLFAAAFLPAQDPELHGEGDLPRRRARAPGRSHPPDRRAGQVPERGGAVDDGTPARTTRCSSAFEETGMVLGMHTFPAPNYPHPLGSDYLALARRAVQPRRHRLADVLVRPRDAGVAVAGAAHRPARPLPEAEDGGVRVERGVAPVHARDVRPAVQALRAASAARSSDRLPSEAFHQQCVISFESDETGRVPPVGALRRRSASGRRTRTTTTAPTRGARCAT